MNGNVRLKSRMLMATGCLCVVSALTSRVVAQCCDEQNADPATASQGQVAEFLGSSVSIDGTVAVIGAPNYNATIDENELLDSGRVIVFTFNGSIWQQHTILDAGIDTAAFDTFGFSVALDGDIAVIGAPLNDDAGSNSGSAYIFENVSGNWSQVAKLTASVAEAAAGDLFGWSVSVDGDTIVIGAKSKIVGGDRVGRVYVFNKPAGGWVNATEDATLTKSAPLNGDAFGATFSIRDYVIAVGVPGNGGLMNIGAVNIFRLVGGTWTDEQLLTASDGANLDQFGTSVSIDGDLVVGGAPFDDDQGFTTGAAYVFRYDSGTEIWTEEVKLAACDSAMGDEFGFSTAIDGNVVVVGARENGFPQDNGTAHAFRYLSAGWAQVETLLADDADTSDAFGTSVSLLGGNAVVGAPFWAAAGGSGEGAMYGFTGLDSAAACNCPWDLNGDGTVSTADLLAIFAAWGTCTDCNACPADLDNDCSVGTTDLLILLSNWGQCVEPTLPMQDVQDCYDRFYPNDTAALIACIAALSE